MPIVCAYRVMIRVALRAQPQDLKTAGKTIDPVAILAHKDTMNRARLLARDLVGF